ncbi:hypothetical protein ABI59_14030 [Acidobacteria bacterium Mor1]|nr:hypothetical protein ABI59_14030 [Acidobacteria bacterium Mor1]
MKRPDFSYTIYIRATQEEVWRAFLEPEFTRQYWVHENRSDWKVGSKWAHVRTDEKGTTDIVGEVLESEPFSSLVFSWCRPGDENNPQRTSRVSVKFGNQDWPGGPWTVVTLEHTDFQGDEEMQTGVSGGWPMVLSGMKTLLEAGLRENWVLPKECA